MRPTILAALVLLVSACAGQGTPAPTASPTVVPPTAATPATPTPSPVATAAPTPTPLTASFAVLATPANGLPTYTVSLLGTDGRVAASAVSATRSGLTCTFGQGAGTVLPSETVSATNDRVYYLDGNTTVRWLGPDGSKGQADSVPGGGSVGSTFAVSPDDQRMAVVTADYSQSPIPFRIYIEDAGGGNRTQIFSASSSAKIPWAVGWHGGHLVLGYVPACTQGGGPFSAFPTEIHVIDEATAVRSATLGSSTCPVESLPGPYGALCAQASGAFTVLGWDGGSRATITFGPDQYFSLALSPGGGAAACCATSGEVLYVGQGTTARVPGGARSLGFIDDGHLLIGGDTPQDQPRIYNLGPGTTTPVNALGDFLARIPGGL